MGDRIVIMAAGTGGHVFPGLAVAQELVFRGHQVSWLGTPNGMENRLVPTNGIEIDVVDVKGLRRNGLLGWISAPFGLLRAAWQSLVILRRRRPDVVIGMGGYVTGPGGVVARVLGIPLVIHEQNAVPGMANRLLSRIARRVLEAFPGSFPPQINARAVGNPVRPEIVALAQPDQHPAQDHATPRVLVIGGSLGAQVLNETVPLAVAASGMEIEIWHQTGRGKLDATNALYRQMGIDADLSEFINDMAAAYGWADLVICRAGALTVSELAAAGVASILVPYAYAVDDHQTHNARYLSDSGAALLMPQSDLNGESLGRALRQLLSDRDGLAKRAMSARRLGVLTAAADVADVCEEVMAQ